MKSVETHNTGSNSILMCLATVFLNILSGITEAEILVWVTIAAGVTTVGYNCVNIYLKWKSKK